MKICQYLLLHLKIICWRFHIKTPFTFWDMHTWGMWKICLQILQNNMLKIGLLLRNLQTSRANHLTILRIKNAKFARYCFYMNTKMKEDFQICITIPLRTIFKVPGYLDVELYTLPYTMQKSLYWIGKLAVKICF